MSDRSVLEQRLATLDSLLEGTGGWSSPAGATLTDRLRDGWRAEGQLLRRLLADTPREDVRATLDLWQARTAAFLERADGPDAAWTDRSGQRWMATQVLALLDDLRERLDSWAASADPLPDRDEEGD